jgi:hypothetical protein
MGGDNAKVPRAVRLFAIFAACVLAAEHASAEEPSSADRERLAKLTSDGAKAARAEKWEECIAAYTAAKQIEQTPVRLGELGLCEEAHGERNVDAYHHLHAAVNGPGIDRKRDPYKRYADALARVGTRVAEVYVSVDPPQAVLLIDGQPIGTSDGRTHILKPGHHDFAAQLEGYKTRTDPRDLIGGQRAEVFLPLEREPTPPVIASTAAPRPTASPVAPRPSASTRPSVSSWILARPERIALTAAAGLAALTALGSGGAAIGLELHFQSMREAVVKQGYQPDTCTKPIAPKACAELRNRSNNADGASYAAITAAVATGVFAGATVLTFVLDRAHPRPSVALTVSPEGGGIGVMGAW